MVAAAAIWFGAAISASLAQSRPESPSKHEPQAPAPQAAKPPAEVGKHEADSGATLDRLFARLAQAKDDDEAAGITRQIERRWMQSGSDTADLLMGRAVVALAAGDQPLAVELLDRVVTIRPAWAEAWNKRATVFTLMGDQQRAVADIQKTLSLEPRHFGALSGLGTIFSANDDDKHALDAYRRALAINPFLDAVKERVKRLEPDVDGRDL
ncbi:hypothetical protein [Chelatococcus reniformis]|uniref:Tetratricopeptide repeat protein n=1 Tax=Chelatococcus reniformis TaxID=1494448 RepID=A0A916XCR4_9HYPH|nr:hypothetical protein [Chelatococcus reniformis]GGC63963.1 hypothetical protein GCM10010994_23200 [Chelatococcus reniformis]